MNKKLRVVISPIKKVKLVLRESLESGKGGRGGDFRWGGQRGLHGEGGLSAEDLWMKRSWDKLEEQQVQRP